MQTQAIPRLSMFGQEQCGAVVGPGGASVSLPAIAAEMVRIGQPRRVQGVFAPQVGEDPRLKDWRGSLCA